MIFISYRNEKFSYINSPFYYRLSKNTKRLYDDNLFRNNDKTYIDRNYDNGSFGNNEFDKVIDEQISIMKESTIEIPDPGTYKDTSVTHLPGVNPTNRELLLQSINSKTSGGSTSRIKENKDEKNDNLKSNKKNQPVKGEKVGTYLMEKDSFSNKVYNRYESDLNKDLNL